MWSLPLCDSEMEATAGKLACTSPAFNYRLTLVSRVVKSSNLFRARCVWVTIKGRRSVAHFPLEPPVFSRLAGFVDAMAGTALQRPALRSDQPAGTVAVGSRSPAFGRFP